MVMISLGRKHLLKQETSQLLFTSPSPCCAGGWSVGWHLCIVTATLHLVDSIEIVADDHGISEAEGQASALPARK